MRAGHLASRRVGVSELVVAGRDRPGGSSKTCGGIDGEIGDGIRGGFGWGSKQDCGRRPEAVSGSERVQWSGVEQDGGRFITHLDLRRAKHTVGSKLAILYLKGTESSALIAAVLG